MRAFLFIVLCKRMYMYVAGAISLGRPELFYKVAKLGVG